MKGLEPAPITPVDEHPYELLSGTIKATYNKHRGRALRGEDEIVIAPGIMSGNTGEQYGYFPPRVTAKTLIVDTRHYWGLTEHIFRYNHRNQGNGSALAGGVHTTNEGEFIKISSTGRCSYR